MMRIVYVLLMGFIASITTSVFASTAGRGNYGTTPDEILDRVAWEANAQVKIQDTQLDKVNSVADQAYEWKYKLANTLNSIRVHIDPYLQWFMFIGLSVATLLIIITGFQLVTSVQSGSDTKKAQSRIKNIAIGLLVLTWCYIILRLFMSLLAYATQ